MTAAASTHGLMVYDHVPANCRLELMMSDHHAPYFRAGEWAVVDTTPAEIEFGKLYAVQDSRRVEIWQVCDEPERDKRRRRDGDTQPVAWLRRMAKQDVEAELEIADAYAKRTGRIPHLRLFFSDGPIHPDYLQELIVGKVIGVYQVEDMPLRITAAV